MKFTAISTALTLIAASLSAVSAHTSMMDPAPRSHPKNPNAVDVDFSCIMAPLQTSCGNKPFPCGGYPQDSKITRTLKAGEVINVKFWNQNFPNGPSPGDAGANQARHSGGLCEFSLSYDGGKTFNVIGQYHKTCPDIFFDWPVLIPKTAPSCKTPGKCLFVWTWINATGNREFYMNCADVFIEGTAGGKLPKRDITRANMPGVPGFSKIMTPEGDTHGNTKGDGPSKADIQANTGGKFADGGSSGNGGNGGNGGDGGQTSTTTTAAGKPTGKPGKPPGKTTTTSAPKPTIPPKTGGGNGGSSGGSCSTEGALTCDGSTGFFICDHSQLVRFSCPGGTTCKNGACS